jgi:superfamily I DNA/RNA helicase
VFTGAEPSYIRNFADQFKGGKIEAIADCFRCQPHIIYTAQGFIEAFNPGRIKKPKPKCSRPEGAPVCVHSIPSDGREAEIMAAMIADAVRDGDVLVLVPKADYAGQLKAALRRRRIAFNAPSDRPTEASQIFAALRNWLSDNRDNLAFRELLSAICDGGMLKIPGPRVRKPDKVIEREAALATISDLWTGVFDGASLPESLSAAAKKNQICAELNGVANELAIATQGTPTKFGQRTFQALRPWRNSERMLEELAASRGDTHSSMDGDASSVRIMTVRNSKGLEAESVFVVGLEEGAFPAKGRDSPQFEEDARLFFVSMTRAKRELHLFHARIRPGGNTYQPDSFNLKPSPFLDGLPKGHYETKYHQSAVQRAAKKSRSSK